MSSTVSYIIILYIPGNVQLMYFKKYFIISHIFVCVCVCNIAFTVQITDDRYLIPLLRHIVGLPLPAQERLVREVERGSVPPPPWWADGQADRHHPCLQRPHRLRSLLNSTWNKATMALLNWRGNELAVEGNIYWKKKWKQKQNNNIILDNAVIIIFLVVDLKIFRVVDPHSENK